MYNELGGDLLKMEGSWSKIKNGTLEMQMASVAGRRGRVISGGRDKGVCP